MPSMPYHTALIVGAGAGISASLARGLAAEGVRVGLAARRPDKLGALAGETGAETFAVDAADPTGVADLFAEFDRRLGAPDIVVYNASGRLRGSILDLDPEAVRNAIAVSAFGGFLVAQQAAKRMVRQGKGAILFTGA